MLVRPSDAPSKTTVSQYCLVLCTGLDRPSGHNSTARQDWLLLGHPKSQPPHHTSPQEWLLHTRARGGLPGAPWEPNPLPCLLPLLNRRSSPPWSWLLWKPQSATQVRGATLTAKMPAPPGPLPLWSASFPTDNSLSSPLAPWNSVPQRQLPISSPPWLPSSSTLQWPNRASASAFSVAAPLKWFWPRCTRSPALLSPTHGDIGTHWPLRPSLDLLFLAPVTPRPHVSFLPKSEMGIHS